MVSALDDKMLSLNEAILECLKEGGEKPVPEKTEEVDAEIIERFAGLDRAQGEELGLEVSVKAAQAAAPYADGFYLMTPFNRIALMERLIARLKDEGIAD